MGLAGWMARAFIESPLTPLLLVASFLVGLMGMIITPREEDPQISVPMVDIMVAYPGASAAQVVNLVSEPLERLMSELSGVKHVYSISRDGFSLVIVRFKVGEQMEPSLVKLYDKLQSHMDAIPKGVMPPLVKPKSIDDVPVVTITLSSGDQDIVTLRKLALDVMQRFKALPDTGQSFIVGGSQEQVRVEVDPCALDVTRLDDGTDRQGDRRGEPACASRQHRGRQPGIHDVLRRVSAQRQSGGRSGRVRPTRSTAVSARCGDYFPGRVRGQDHRQSHPAGFR